MVQHRLGWMQTWLSSWRSWGRTWSPRGTKKKNPRRQNSSGQLPFVKRLSLLGNMNVAERKNHILGRYWGLEQTSTRHCEKWGRATRREGLTTLKTCKWVWLTSLPTFLNVKTFLCAKPALNIQLTIAHSNFFRMSHLVLAHSEEWGRHTARIVKLSPVR